jgi:hypothetical protein
MHQEQLKRTLTITQNESEFKKNEKIFIWKNLFLIFFSMFFFVTALNTISSVQSNLIKNEAEKTTLVTTIVIYSVYSLFSIVLPQIFLNYIGFRWTLTIAFVMPLIYIGFYSKKTLNY